MSQILEIPSEGIRRKALVETVEKSRPSFHAASQVSAGTGEETAEKMGAEPRRAETEMSWPSAPSLTADDDDFGVFEGMLSVLMIYGYVFLLAVIFWNAHPISHWLYNHAQQLMGMLR